MADINYNVGIKVDKGNLSSQINVSTITASMAAVGLRSETMTLTTHVSSIMTANLASVGMAFMRNLATATQATAQIGIDSSGTFVPFSTLRAGEPALLRLNVGSQYRVKGTDGGLFRVDITEG